MAKYAVLRTHGGLGNQLFQVLFGRLFCEQSGLTLCEVHDNRYRHGFPRSMALTRGREPSYWQKQVSAVRIPKLIERACLQSEAPWKFGRSIYLDGYFQRVENYTLFPANAIMRQLDRLSNELAIEPADLEPLLVHLRLGDFFADRVAAQEHVMDRLVRIPKGAHVITNDETLLHEPDVAAVMQMNNTKLISTQGMAAEEVLRTMARYRRIDANDSTLTFWSSVLGGCEVLLRDNRLRACRDLFVRCRPSL